MHKTNYFRCLLIYVTISLLISPLNISHATNLNPTEAISTISPPQWDDELKAILQSSLSIVEIDREIERLESTLAELNVQLSLLDDDLLIQELILIEKKEAAGKVLRSYFMGERQQLLLSLLESRSLEAFLKKLEFYELVMQHDKHIIDSYKKQQIHLQVKYAAYIAEQLLVEQAVEKLELKRQEVVALEKERDEKLAAREDEEQVKQLMEQLTKQWNEEGIDNIEHYLYLLNNAMQEFPAWLQNQSEYSKLKGLSYHIELPEHALNDFLQEQHNDFKHFSFSFRDGLLSAKGQDGEMEVELTGSYTIIDEPSHYIQFTIHSILFNSFTLPQSTIDDLMGKYNLNFYPSFIVSFLQATEITLHDGYLYLTLRLKL